MAWQNLPNTSTPLNATNLNSLENSIESGTWTPIMKNATVSYTLQNGNYKKIGNIVFINCRLRGTITAVDSLGYATIEGLPFTSNNEFAGTLFEHYNCCDNSTNLLVRIFYENSKMQIGLQADTDGAGSSVASWVANQGTFYISISGFYFIS